MLKRAFALIFLLTILLGGCATKPIEQYTQWYLDKKMFEKNIKGNVYIKALNGKTYTVRTEYLWNYYQVSLKLINLTGISTALYITNYSGLNAFAGKSNGVNQIGFTIDMLNTFGNDPEVIAFIVGHELAHLYLNHQSEQASRKQTTDRTSAVIGGALGAFIPFGGKIANIGANAFLTAYSRDDERDADKQGMAWAVAAGYSPCGFVRLQKEMMKNDNSSTISFLRTHPMSSERLETAKNIAIKNNFGNCE
jgi:predicted Zn-dependent protease